MIIHHTELDATLWEDYSSRHPLLQKQAYHWNLKFCILFMFLLIIEIILMTALLIVDMGCSSLLAYILMSFFSVILAMGFGIVSVKWQQNTLYYASSKTKFRSNIRAIVLLVGILVPLIGSYFFVWEGHCSQYSSSSTLILSAFAVQIIRSPVTLSIQ